MLIEITTFHLKDDVDETTFLEADARVQTEFIPNLPGFVRRTTARGADGDRLVLTFWSSDTDADRAASLALDHPATKAFDELVDAATVRATRYTTLD